MPDDQLAKYSAKIKDVYIELKNYQFLHSPYYKNVVKNRFIGREKVKDRIISILKHTDTKSGSYLITGFRGMGKTSVIRQALSEHNKEQENKNKYEHPINVIFSFIGKFFRILICCIITYLLIQYFITDYPKLNGSKLSYSNFLELFNLSARLLIACFLFVFSVLGSIYSGTTLGQFYKEKTTKIKMPLWIWRLLIALGFIVFIFFLNCYAVLGIELVFGWFEIILFNLFALFAFCAFVSNKVFEDAWNGFQILFIIFLFAAVGVFFLNHDYVCNRIGCDSSVVGLMRNFFPVRDDNDLPSTVYRLIISILVSYIILSLIVFLIDFFSLLRIRLISFVFASDKIKESKKYHWFEINLSQDSLEEMEILRRMTIAIEGYWLEKKFHFGNVLFNRKFYLPWRFIISKLNRPREEHFKPSYKSVLTKLGILRNRMSGEVTTRRERKAPPNMTTPLGGGFEIVMPVGTYSNNDEISYPVATAKEAEDQLQEILDDIDKLRQNDELEIPQFAFIIDELDKIDPHNNSIIQERESANPVLDRSIYAEDTNRFRQRREAVGKLLANLKGFLNVARAKFFFIGGREMFDANLADIADRESFYSSIFNDVIYVESFFKESIDKMGQGKGGITQMTETYVCNIILNNLGEYKTHELSLKKLHDLIAGSNGAYLKFKRYSSQVNKPNLSKKDDESDELRKQKYKIISTLQNYIVYLTYRSSGTPKKLTSLTEQLIVKGPKNLGQNGKINNEEFFRDNVIVMHDNGDENGFNAVDLSQKLFLKFGFNTQYELGLTSNLYRPYLIANSRHLKSLGDKLLFSSSFIIDHILKFHPFGFSWRSLELIPEVVLVNREPNLREFIEELMRFYSLNYIRDTSSGIFDYRFRSIIRRELIHLSKTSDLSAAAFNFTLDESLATKRHYKRKLMELREKYSNYSPVPGDNQFVHSLCFVQTILGDLHFYDKEYDEAVLFYTESIQALRLPDAIAERKITRHQFLLSLRNKLKLGLTLEKMRAFDSAFSLYKTLILDAGQYFENIVGKKETDISRKDFAEEHSEEAEDYRTIHLVSMPFVALLAVTEKARNDGITYTNLFTNRKDFLRTINGSLDCADSNDQKFDEYRKYYLMADYYNNVGSILYYKNCQFSRFFENDENYWLDAFLFNQDAKNRLLKQQIAIYNKVDKKRGYDFFPSLSAFNYYWNSLYFLLKYHQKRLAEAIMNKAETQPDNPEEIPLEDNLLALCAGYLLSEGVDMVNSNRLYYIANVVSKIGDSILASLKKDKFTIPNSEFDVLDITNPEKITDKNREANIKWFRDNLGDSLFKAETVLYIYKLAAALYKRAGHNSYYASHLIKILYVIKDLIEVNKVTQDRENLYKFLGINENEKEPFKNIEKIAETVFRATTWNNEVSNRPQILKYREIFDITNDRSKDRELIYNIVNNISDNKEVIVLVEGIKLKLGKYLDKFVDDFRIGKSIISAYGTVSNRYQRMLELKYRTERCYFIMNHVLKLKELFNRDLIYSFEEIDKSEIFKQINEIIIIPSEDLRNVTINDVVAFLIQEALFCSSQLIKMIKLYNPGYVIGYSFIAEAHSRMGDWCQAYDNYLKIIDERIDNYDNHLKSLKEKKASLEQKQKANYSDEIKAEITQLDKNLYDWESNENNWIQNSFRIENLKKDKSVTLEKKFISRIEELLGGESLIYLESKNHYETAVQYYYKMIQIHSDGKTYKDKLHEIYMLEDDYNDNVAHYTIASERIRINTGNIKDKINKLNGKISNSKLYVYKSYLCSVGDNVLQPKINTISQYLEFFAKDIKKEAEENSGGVGNSV